MMEFKKDTIYQKVLDTVVNFQFDEKTVAVFPDMINRSVPGYATMISLTGIVANEFISEKGLVYDLGCSLGASTLSLIKHRKHNDFSIIAIDNSPNMIETCQQLNPDTSDQSINELPKVVWQCDDVISVNLQKSDVIILNLVMQFIAPMQRQELINDIYQSLKPQGALLISEKISFDNVFENKNLDNWQQQFKKNNGYSDLEISQKRKSIEKTMLLDTEAVHLERFKRAGFGQTIKIYQALNFCGWCVIKE